MVRPSSKADMFGVTSCPGLRQHHLLRAAADMRKIMNIYRTKRLPDTSAANFQINPVQAHRFASRPSHPTQRIQQGTTPNQCFPMRAMSSM